MDINIRVEITFFERKMFLIKISLKFTINISLYKQNKKRPPKKILKKTNKFLGIFLGLQKEI